ncbi:MAG: CoA-binding protein [Pseudomonadota bacterium]
MEAIEMKNQGSHRLKSIKESPLYSIVNPRSVVFFGASNKFTAMGTSLLSSLKAIGFEGNIYPVHPNEERIQDLKAYKSVMDLPEAGDLAVMVLPTHLVPDVLEECGKKGIRHAIVVSGGFKEVGGEGVELERRLKGVAKKYGIRFLGPNCIGVANPYHKLNTTFFQDLTAPGFIGMASQSGSFITQMFDYLSKFGLGFSTGISVGNEADIDIVDCMEYLDACPNTRVIGLYLETIRRGRTFVERARSIAPRKPIVAFYAGGSEAGKKASLSHTGALAGPDPLYDGVFRQSGVIRAHSIEELFDFCWVLGACPKPEGNRVIIQTHSGGPGVATADACGRADLDLPALSSETLEKLAPFIPRTGSLSNPVDLTFTKNPLDYFFNIPKVLMEEKNADGLLIYLLVPTKTVLRGLESLGIPKDQLEEQAAGLIEVQCDAIAGLTKNHHRPLIGYSYRTRGDLFIRGLQDRGIPVLPSPERAARAMQALVTYTRLRESILARGH